MSESNEVVLVNIIDQELQKNNLTEAVLAEIEKNYLPLTLKSVEDKDSYESIRQARLRCKTLRVLSTKICKAGREDAVKIQKDWIAAEKKVNERLSKVEDYLQSQEDIYEQHKEKIKKEKEEKERQRVHDRIQGVINAGFTFDGIKYTIGDVSINASDVPYCNDEVYADTISRGKAEADRIAEEKRLEAERLRAEQEERERKQKEEQDRLEAERVELDKQRKDQEERENKMREEAERIAAEKERMEKDRFANRVKWLSAFGFALVGDAFILRGISISNADALEMDNAEWDEKLKVLAPKVEEIWNRMNAEKEAEGQEQERKEKEAAEKTEQDRIAAEEAERQRQEALKPDKEKLIEYAHQLGMVQMPAVSSSEATGILANALVMLTNVQDFINNSVKSL